MRATESGNAILDVETNTIINGIKSRNNKNKILLSLIVFCLMAIFMLYIFISSNAQNDNKRFAQINTQIDKIRNQQPVVLK